MRSLNPLFDPEGIAKSVRDLRVELGPVEILRKIRDWALLTPKPSPETLTMNLAWFCEFLAQEIEEDGFIRVVEVTAWNEEMTLD